MPIVNREQVGMYEFRGGGRNRVDWTTETGELKGTYKIRDYCAFVSVSIMKNRTLDDKAK